jgi:hypothetical protein
MYIHMYVCIMYITSNTYNTIYTTLCVYLCVFVYLCVCLCVCVCFSLYIHTARAGGHQRRRARILLRETTTRHDFFHSQCLFRLSIYTGRNIYIYITIHLCRVCVHTCLSIYLSFDTGPCCFHPQCLSRYTSIYICLCLSIYLEILYYIYIHTYINLYLCVCVFVCVYIYA